MTDHLLSKRDTYYSRCPTCDDTNVEATSVREYAGSTLVRENIVCRKCETPLSSFDLTERDGYYVETRHRVSAMKEMS